MDAVVNLAVGETRFATRTIRSRSFMDLRSLDRINQSGMKYQDQGTHNVLLLLQSHLL